MQSSNTGYGTTDKTVQTKKKVATAVTASQPTYHNPAQNHSDLVKLLTEAGKGLKNGKPAPVLKTEEPDAKSDAPVVSRAPAKVPAKAPAKQAMPSTNNLDQAKSRAGYGALVQVAKQNTGKVESVEFNAVSIDNFFTP
jgi:hypothetical protein